MSNESRVSARAALARMQAVTDSPDATIPEQPPTVPDPIPQPALRIEPAPSPKTASPVFEQSVRYTVEMPKSLHRRLKLAGCRPEFLIARTGLFQLVLGKDDIGIGLQIISGALELSCFFPKLFHFGRNRRGHCGHIRLNACIERRHCSFGGFETSLRSDPGTA